MKEKLYKRVLEYYDSQDWKYDAREEEIDGNTEFNIRMIIDVNDMDAVKVRTIIGEKKISTYTYLNTNIPEDKFDIAIEYITRANYGLRIGNFEMDLDDGEVRYIVYSIWDGDILPSLKMLEKYIDVGFFMMSRYGKHLIEAVNGEVSVKEAIRIAEEK